MSIALLASAGKGAAPKLYVEDVFSTYLYTGNGATQTINNGIDLAGKGGLVWCKSRSQATVHSLWDTSRGVGKRLNSALTAASEIVGGTYGVNAFNSNGFSIKDDVTGNYEINGSSGTYTYASWTFRKAPKFFDIVTWTGDGVVDRVISHSLDSEIGLITAKATSTAGVWWTYHKDLGTKGLYLNTTDAQDSGLYPAIVNKTTTAFQIGTAQTASLNANGVTYIAYLYAHDTSAEGIIQCGSFTTSGTGTINATVNLGYEPQYVMIKKTNGTGNWTMWDTMRGLPAQGATSYALYPNLSNAEGGNNAVKLTSTGFITDTGNDANTYIYMAIRRPNKVPTSGTQVYNAIARTGTGAVATVSGVGFAPDLVLSQVRTNDFQNVSFDRLRGASAQLCPDSTQAEVSTTTQITSFNMDGITLDSDATYRNINWNTKPYINHFFKRAKGFMDIVCYTGTGVARTVNHNLGVVPEFIITKVRDGASNWRTLVTVNPTGSMPLNTNGQIQDNPIETYYGNDTVYVAPTSSVFTVGSSYAVNSSGLHYVAYLFATLAGISKVGSYTGNGTSINLDMGFTSGCRFFLVKRTDSTRDWYIFDTVRGIVSANDPHLSLNTAAAEVTTDDSVDPYSLGITVNQVAATNINVSSATYIYLAIA